MILAIDTATPAVTAGVARRTAAGVEVLAERITIDARAHAEQLTPNVIAAVGDAGITFADLAAVVVGCGPGPFTGLRVGLAFAAMLMAGLDGIKNKIDPGPAMDKDLYDLPKEELKTIPTVCGSLREALESLDKDRAFLKAGGVFDDDFIDSFIELKMTEVERFEMTPHPVEFDMYYSQ